jgi:hypothetical protein
LHELCDALTSNRFSRLDAPEECLAAVRGFMRKA